MTVAEQVVMLLVTAVCVAWDVLIIYQIWRGETFAFSSQQWEQPRTRSRAMEPVAFWTAIGLQAIFPNGAILYLLVFLSTSMGWL